MTKLQIAGFIFALVGWLLLFIFLFGHFFLQQLIALEEILKSNTFLWGIRIFVISLVIFMIKGRKLFEKILKYPKIKIALKVIFIGGAIGWIWWLISLVV